MSVLLAEMPSADALLAALRTLRARGYRDLDARVPHEIEELDEALGLQGRKIPTWTLLGGIAGAIGSYLLQYWVSAVAWPLDVGGRPLHSAPAFLPITFESTVLGAGIATLVGFLWHARLGKLWEPLDEVDELRSATVDAFWVVLSERDAAFDWKDSRTHLEETGALRVIAVRDPAEERA